MGNSKARKVTDFDSSISALMHEIDLLNCNCNINYIRKRLLSKNHTHKVYVLGYWVHIPVTEYLSKRLVKLGIKAEHLHLGEFKHGPLAIVDKDNFSGIVFNPKDTTYDDTLNNIEEIRARDGWLLAFANEPNKNYNTYFKIPVMKDPMLYPIVEMAACNVLISWLSR